MLNVQRITVTKKYISALTIIAILFISSLLRLHDLGSESIWIDEAFSVKLSSAGFFDVIKGNIEDVNPPFYYILLHFWINLFGDSENSVRFLSALLGIFSVFMTYKTGSLIFDREAGIISSLILGLSTFHIRYSQEARMYSLLSLLSLLSMYFTFRLIKTRSLINSTGYLLSSIFLLYTHVYGIFVIIVQNIFIISMFLFSRQDFKLGLRRWILMQLTLLLLFTPGVMILTYQFLHSIDRIGWIPEPSLLSIINTFITYSGSKTLMVLFLISSVFSIVKIQSIRGNLNRKGLFKSFESYQLNIGFSNTERFYFLILWLLIPVILPFIISKISTPVYVYKYTIEASLAFYLLIAKGITSIRTNNLKILIIFSIILFSSLNIWHYYSLARNINWREIANYIDNNAEPGDLFLFAPGFIQLPFDYYSKRNDLKKKQYYPPKQQVMNEDTRLNQIREGNDKIWLILSERHDPAYGALIESKNFAYREDFNITAPKQGTYPIEVYLFESK